MCSGRPPKWRSGPPRPNTSAARGRAPWQPLNASSDSSRAWRSQRPRGSRAGADGGGGAAAQPPPPPPPLLLVGGRLWHLVQRRQQQQQLVGWHGPRAWRRLLLWMQSWRRWEEGVGVVRPAGLGGRGWWPAAAWPASRSSPARWARKVRGKGGGGGGARTSVGVVV
jgi:hypothetical protein